MSTFLIDLKYFLQVDEIKDAGLYDEFLQAFVDFMGILSVGVQGDQRTHSHVVSLTA